MEIEMVNLDQKHRLKEIDAQVAFDNFMTNALIGALVFMAATGMLLLLDALQ
jgi:hypothetical protein